eukprot:9504604-Alexandrium_andersonii.AAC.1
MPRTRQFNVMNGRTFFPEEHCEPGAPPGGGSPRLCNPHPEVRDPSPSVLWYAGGAQRPFPR